LGLLTDVPELLLPALPLVPELEPLPGVAGVGAAGVTAEEGADAGPGPNPLLAVTVNVYAVPFAKPLTVIGDEMPDALMPPGEAITVYPVIGFPPFHGSENETDAEPSAGAAVTSLGARGAVGPWLATQFVCVLM
jgi:hypothetical protein